MTVRELRTRLFEIDDQDKQVIIGYERSEGVVDYIWFEDKAIDKDLCDRCESVIIEVKAINDIAC